MPEPPAPPVPPVAPGATLVLPGAGTLQSAIDAASAGDVLYLASGTYTSSGQAVVQILPDASKDITLRAVIAGHAVLDGEDQRQVISISSGTVVLEGLGITRGTESSYGGGVYIYAGTVTLNNCNIYSNIAGWNGGGVYISGSSTSVTSESCEIYSNTADVCSARRHQTRHQTRHHASSHRPDGVLAFTDVLCMAPFVCSQGVS